MRYGVNMSLENNRIGGYLDPQVLRELKIVLVNKGTSISEWIRNCAIREVSDSKQNKQQPKK